MPTFALYPFRFRDPLTGKWVRAWHKMQVPELQRQYSEWEVTGTPEIWPVQPASPEQFDPFRAAATARAVVGPMLLLMR